ncbi:hypothetical protein LP420_07600 [Massilia sp. B-10]|nr:hypothetical protein LP420_07600 [Massilia sp. B-10]
MARRPCCRGEATLADPALYRLQGITLQARDSSDAERHAKLDLTRQLGSFDIKGGFKFSRRTKDNDTDQWGYTSKTATSPNYWGA